MFLITRRQSDAFFHFSVAGMRFSDFPVVEATAPHRHKTRSIFDHYNIVSLRDLREAMQRTPTYLIATAEDEKKRQAAQIRALN